ncbi:MAG TPA: LLM class flavin-dependent oxidoreductase [Jatrophihabitans sp.]|nr:LLM class flavin-dependent oxidoreductase [Jatrophihabitans sp.]
MLIIGKALGFDPATDARRAESLGYDGVRAIDHYFSAIPPAQPVAVAHCFVTITAAAGATEYVRLTQTMIAASMHHPFEIAQAVATLDRVSGGRAELGLGTGWLGAEHDGMGLPLGGPGDRVARVVESATVCRAMFENDGCVHFEGRFFRAHSDARWPATPHRPEIMMGAHGRRLIAAAAAVADRIDLAEALIGCRPNFTGYHGNTVDNLASRIRLADEAAVEAGHGRRLRFSATVNLQVAPDRPSRDAARTSLAEAAGCGSDDLERELLRVIATPDEVIEKVRALGALGVDRLHIRPMDDYSQRWLDEALKDIQEVQCRS